MCPREPKFRLCSCSHGYRCFEKNAKWQIREQGRQIDDQWPWMFSCSPSVLQVHVGCTFLKQRRDFPYVLLTIWRRSPFLNDRSEAVLDS